MAKKKTLQQQFIAALSKMGYSADPLSRVTRFVVMQKPGDPRKFFVGSHGALRVGANSTTSIPVSDAGKAKILQSLEG